MPKEIKDKFTNLPISRQRKYQLRMLKRRRCTVCGDKQGRLIGLCDFHADARTEYSNKRYHEQKEQKIKEQE